jgi:hypothetical protein
MGEMVATSYEQVVVALLRKSSRSQFNQFLFGFDPNLRMQTMEKEAYNKRGHVVLEGTNYPRWSEVMKRAFAKNDIAYVIQEDWRKPDGEEDPAAQEVKNKKLDKDALAYAEEKSEVSALMVGKSLDGLNKTQKGKVAKRRLKTDGDEAMAIMVDACDTQNTARVKGITVPSFMWNKLADHHKKMTNQNVSNLTDKIGSLCQEDCRDLLSYLAQQKAVYDLLLDAGGILSEHAFCLKVIRNLAPALDVAAGLLSATSSLAWEDLERQLESANDTVMARRARAAKKAAKSKPPAEADDFQGAVSRAVAKALRSQGSWKKPREQREQGICYQFRDSGTCRWGKKCRFKHVEAESKNKKQKKSSGQNKSKSGDSSSDSDSDS